MAADRVASAHPHPFAGGRIELPKIIEIAGIAIGIVAPAPKEPEMAAVIGPTGSAIASSGGISGSMRTQRTVDSGLTAVVAECAASTHPCPFACLRIGCHAKARQQDQHLKALEMCNGHDTHLRFNFR